MQMELEVHARELVFKNGLVEFCHLLNAHQVPFLIWKGSALAYDYYPDPSLRPRIDSDILISPSDKDKVFSLLKQENYRQKTFHGDLWGQVVFTHTTKWGEQIFDLHWEVFAQQDLKTIFTFAELWGERKKIATLPAYTVNDLAAVQLAVIHWVGHHFMHPEPHWLEDLRLLTTARTPQWWEELKCSCAQKKIEKVVHESLLIALGESPWSSAEVCQFSTSPLNRLLDPQRNHWRDFLSDFYFLKGKKRLHFLKCHVLPDSRHLRSKYGALDRCPRLFLYLWHFLKVISRVLKVSE